MPAKSASKKSQTSTKSTKTSSKTRTSKSTKKTKTSTKNWAKNLLIVESPAKSNTIKKFLWKDWDVAASMWHVIDLPKKWFWIDIDNNFDASYEVMPDKKKVVSELKKLAKNYEQIWLATDEDREWEAIAWHLLDALKLKKDTPRIVFHEITKDAILQAVENPRKVDVNLVNSQQARRLLDRIVWFKVSPVLWSKVKRWLSAGRVQSVAVKLIVEKEREIQSFKPDESWKVKAEFSKENINFIWVLDKIDWEKVNLTKEKDLDKVFSQIWISKKAKNLKDEKTWNKIIRFDESFDFEVKEVKSTSSKRTPWAPFITSTLQQEASNKLWWWVKQVMSVAQKLYENWFITYMRTDSVSLSSWFLKNVAWFVNARYWKDYLQTRNYKSKSKWAQEAHEAIRPTNINNVPDSMSLSANEKKLYTLIWLRTLASQMADAKLENKTIKLSIKDKDQERLVKWQTIKFNWFMQVWLDYFGKLPMQETLLPKLKKSEIIKNEYIWAYQNFTKPPSRYTEASLVKKLESEWIWRPSTYAPTISTIIERWYVEKKEDKKLYPSDIAFLVNDFLEKNFEKLMDYKFTAKLEEKLDKISEWKQDWKKMLENFWKEFKKDLEKSDTSEKAVLYVWEECPECWWNLVYKFWKTGKFIWCDNYPDCKYVTNTKEEQDYIQKLKDKYEWKPCPEWWNIVVKVWRYWPFLASDRYPEVKWIGKIQDEKTTQLQEEYGGDTCDKCGEWTMVVKKWKRGPFLACDKYPKCKNAKSIPKKWKNK